MERDRYPLPGRRAPDRRTRLPSSESTDRITKPALYAAAGIAAYCRVELEGTAGITVVVYRLAGANYVEEQQVHAGQNVAIEWPLACQLQPENSPDPATAERAAA